MTSSIVITYSLLEMRNLKLQPRYSDPESTFLHEPQMIHKPNKALEAQYLSAIPHNSLS